MKVSIITVCFNSERTISTAIESVIMQKYPDIEHIIIDGASTDKTFEIIQSYGNKISKLISEPDNGIYDAMNKGIKIATGEIIGTLNSDDLYIDNQVISDVVKAFGSNIDLLYGDLFYVKKNNTDSIIRKWKSTNFKKNSFKNGWHPPHPTFFVKKNIYNKYGAFNLDYKLAADFELMLRFMEKHQLKNFYLNKTMVKMRLGGATNKNLKNILYQNIECYKAFKKNQLPVSILYPIFRLLPKLSQYFEKYN